jgi:Tfp pilus assembly protein PilV
LAPKAVTGDFSVHKHSQAGFSFIELLVSLLFISSAILAYTQLIMRIKATQYHAGENLQSILQEDYAEQEIRIYSALCSDLDNNQIRLN